MPLFGCCIRKVVDVKSLDYRHSGLNQVPSAVFNAERSLEELHIDSNQIKVLPREIFHCHSLRILTLSDNEITSIPPAVSALTNIEKLDLSKNGIVELPENLKTLKYLSVLDASVNPLGKLPDGFTQLLNLTQVCLNDCFLEYIPGNFGRLSQLKTLELRENHLKTLPQSLARLTELERLDIGCNEFTELSGSVVATLKNLLELWCDSNQITSIPKEIGNLKQLMYFDACKNRITDLPDEIDGCISLSDLHLSTNLLKTLPHSIGRLSNITTLKVDDNQLVSLPSSIGGLVSLSEFDVSANDLEEIPPTIGLLRHLRTLIADENFLADIPCELGSCSGLTVLSVRSNRLTYLPDEIGRIPRLRVLNLSDNEVKVLPYSLMNLKELQALWLAENQSKALIRLQAATDPETNRRCLTCYLLPQQRMDPIDSYGDDSQSFHPSLWEEQRQQRLQIQFEDAGSTSCNVNSSYPKEMRVRTRHMKNEAIRKTTEGGDAENDNSPNEQTASNILLGSAPDSPKTSTHRLVKLEKEKVAKDKARINRHSQEVNTEDVQLSLLAHHKQNSSQDLTRQPNKLKDRRHSKLSERGLDADSTTVSSPSGKINGSSLSSIYSQPKTIQNGHYHASSSSHLPSESRSAANTEVKRTPSSRSAARDNQSHHDTSRLPYSSQQSLRGQPYDRYLTSQLQLQDTPDSSRAPADTARTPADTSRAPVDTARAPADTARTPADTSRARADISRSQADKLSTSNNQMASNQEETFGVFVSNEDPKMYQRRFKYYQRMQKHRKNPEVQSDLGYYNSQFKGASRAASDTRSRPRYPLQQGRDGHEWERYSQRSVGDGYASDVDGFSYAGQRMHHLSSRPGYSRGISRKSANGSNGNVSQHRPTVPPSYNMAIAKRNESKQLENNVFPPPPPPYKPPTRDPGPDGASNDGVPRSSPLHEDATNHDNTPFKSYGVEENIRNVNTSFMNVTANPVTSALHAVTSTPVTPSLSKRPSSMGVIAHENTNGASYYSPIENCKKPALVQRSNSTNTAKAETSAKSHQLANQRSKFYDASEDGPADTAYAAQISKSLGRLGYGRESDKKLTRPHSQMLSTANDMVPPPALFSGAPSDNGVSWSNTSELYGVVNKPGIETVDSQIHMPRGHPTSHKPLHSGVASSPYQQMANGHLPSAHSVKHTSNYSYLPPPTRKSPKLPHKQIIPTGLEVDPPSKNRILKVSIAKNPGLGFSIAGGVGLQGNPYKPHDEGIFITKIHTQSANEVLSPGDKILAVNGVDFNRMEHNTAVNILKQQPAHVEMVIERTTHLPTDV